MNKYKIFIFLLLHTGIVFAQDDVVVGDDGSDAVYRSSVAALPVLDYERTGLELSPALSVASVSAIAEDASGNLYILHRGRESAPIIVADSAGRVLRSFGAGLFSRPHGIRIDPEGSIWTVDSTSSIVYKFSPAGVLLLKIEVGDLFDPGRESCAASDIAFADNGHIYITDGYCNARVVEYDASGVKVREWGSPGNGPGQFNLPHAIVAGPEGTLLVADRENGRVQRFDMQGNFIDEWFYGGRVLSISFNADGELFIGAEPKGAQPMAEASLIQIDPQNGQMLGRIPGFAHELGVSRDGDLLAASLSGDITIYRLSR